MIMAVKLTGVIYENDTYIKSMKVCVITIIFTMQLISVELTIAYM